MKSIEEIFNEVLNEMTVTGDVATPDIPLGVVSSWKKMVDYTNMMNKKFTFHSVAYKTSDVSRGHKGHLTKFEKKFTKIVDDSKLDMNETVKRLMNIYPPKYI